MEAIHNYILENWWFLCKAGLAGMGVVAFITFAFKSINSRWRWQRTDANKY